MQDDRGNNLEEFWNLTDITGPGSTSVPPTLRTHRFLSRFKSAAGRLCLHAIGIYVYNPAET